MGRDLIVISAVSGCQQEDGIMGCNHFAQSKDRASRKSLIPGEGSCSVRKGHTLIRNCQKKKKSAGDDMLASESKLSRFTATNRTITAPVHQAMKNSKGQEHQTERDKKLAATAEGEKSEYPNHASAFFFQLKVKLPQLSNLGNTRRPQNLHKKNNLHDLLYVSHTMTKLSTILLSVQSSFLVMPALS